MPPIGLVTLRVTTRAMPMSRRPIRPTPAVIVRLSAAPCASCWSITVVISTTPRTSPTFQSVLGEPAIVLWQLTQACVTMVSATATRTTFLPSRTSFCDITPFGLALR
jgi:hypothetical protein